MNIFSSCFTAPIVNLIRASERISSGDLTAKVPTIDTNDEIKIIDGTGQAATNTLTVDPNGLRIASSDDALTITDNRAAITLVYYNAAQGWVLAEN